MNHILFAAILKEGFSNYSQSRPAISRRPANRLRLPDRAIINGALDFPHILIPSPTSQLPKKPYRKDSLGTSTSNSGPQLLRHKLI